MRRVQTPTTDAQARERLEAYRRTHGPGPHRAAILAEVIWPDTKWRAAQGAGASASRVLKRLGFQWGSNARNWGWYL